MVGPCFAAKNGMTQVFESKGIPCRACVAYVTGQDRDRLEPGDVPMTPICRPGARRSASVWTWEMSSLFAANSGKM
jgi:hypothetical protein